MQNRLDLNYIIGEMIAELACGHAYVNPGEIKGPERIPMGLLGAELSRDKSGFYRIDKILPGAIYSQKLRSPLTEPGIGVKKEIISQLLMAFQQLLLITFTVCWQAKPMS